MAIKRILDPGSRQLRDEIHNTVRRGGTLAECAAMLAVAPSTFRDFVLRNPNIQRLIAHARAQGNMELRSAQHDMALNPDNRFAGPMLIWLGKNRLGQRDRDALPVEPIPGLEEAREVRDFAELAATAAETLDQEERIPLPALQEEDAEFVLSEKE